MTALDGVALVIGASRGVGASVARALAEAGMAVAVAARGSDELTAIAEGINGLPLTVDVLDRGSIERGVLHAQEELGPIDLMVVNAAMFGPQELLADPDAWWTTFEVNVRGTYMCNWAVIPGMMARQTGRVVNIASGAGHMVPTSLPASLGTPTAYGPSKAATHRFTEMIAAHLSASNVFVFSVSPGTLASGMTAGLLPLDTRFTSPERTAELITEIAAGRLDRLCGRFIHAADDPMSELLDRVDAICDGDLNAVRLRR